MYTTVIPSEPATVSAATVAPGTSAVSTTLYDFIRIIQGVVGSHGDACVVDVVAYLLHSGYVAIETDTPAREVSVN